MARRPFVGELPPERARLIKALYEAFDNDGILIPKMQQELSEAQAAWNDYCAEHEINLD